MNIKTTTKHTVTVQASDLKRNLCSAYVQMLQDELEAKTTDFEYFKMDLDRLQDELNSIEKHGFTQTFRDGSTMMLLNNEDFEFVDTWFNKPKSNEEELVVRILDHLGKEIEVVKHEDLSY